MKYRLFILFVFGIICVCSCGNRKDRFTCVFSSITDDEPFECTRRHITCTLKFRNEGKDSIFFPFYGLGHIYTKSHFYIKCKEHETSCPATFWGTQRDTHVVAPGDYTRIEIVLYEQQLDELHIRRDVDVRDLKDMITIHYKYNALDTSFCKLYTPQIEIVKGPEIEVIYDYLNGQQLDF